MARRMRATINPVLEPGGHYPHHNLYYIVSDKWDLEVLGGLLLSTIGQAFVEAYCVRMRGGTLRFQAQYLRQIRVPQPDSIRAPVADAVLPVAEAEGCRGIELFLAQRLLLTWLQSSNSYRPTRAEYTHVHSELLTSHLPTVIRVAMERLLTEWSLST